MHDRILVLVDGSATAKRGADEALKIAVAGCLLLVCDAEPVLQRASPPLLVRDPAATGHRAASNLEVSS